jgi:hypothetical protein
MSGRNLLLDIDLIKHPFDSFACFPIPLRFSSLYVVEVGSQIWSFQDRH